METHCVSCKKCTANENSNVRKTKQNRLMLLSNCAISGKKKSNFISSNDGSQNTFVYQPTLDALELKKGKGTDFVFSWKSKGAYDSKLKTLYAAFLNSIKLSEYKIGIKFDKDP